MSTEPIHNSFTVRVVCSNCLTEYDHTFALGTRLDMEGYSDGRHLVDATNQRYTNGMGYAPAVKVNCLHCGVPALERKLRTA